MAGPPIAFYGLLNCLEEVLFIERLGQKLNRSRLHCLHGGWDITMARKENNGDLQPDLGHPFLQVESAQTWQS